MNAISVLMQMLHYVLTLQHLGHLWDHLQTQALSRIDLVLCVVATCNMHGACAGKTPCGAAAGPIVMLASSYSLLFRLLISTRSAVTDLPSDTPFAQTKLDKYNLVTINRAAFVRPLSTSQHRQASAAAGRRLPQ